LSPPHWRASLTFTNTAEKEVMAMDGPSRILVVDDDEHVRDLLQTILEDKGYAVRTAADGEQALTLLADADRGFDLVLTDLRMPRLDGMELLKRLKDRGYPAHVIMLSGYATIESAVEATKRGAYDYLCKPIKSDALLRLIRRALEEQQLKRENEALRKELTKNYQRTDLLGKSPSMRELFRLIEETAQTESTVLIQGESGTGKEMVARAIHALSPRQPRPFVAVNCGGIAETLLESELFGHLRGAFTGAVRESRGLFQAAEGGTLLLDEIGETTMPMQVKLLRVLQEREVRPVGGVRGIKIDVRFVAATNGNLEEQVQAGRVRSDLFYRLNVIAIRVPPLRERVEDIPLLADHFLAIYRTLLKKPVRAIAPETMRQLLNYPWPGNVRELKHAIERAVALTQAEVIHLRDLPPQVTRLAPAPVVPETVPTLAEAEKAHLVSALYATGWNQTEAAKHLGINRVTLWRKIKEYGLKPPADG
jgi:two-component system, NtrC family, response regulator AtoC